MLCMPYAVVIILCCEIQITTRNLFLTYFVNNKPLCHSDGVFVWLLLVLVFLVILHEYM